MIIDEKKYEMLEKAQEITWCDYLSDAKKFVKDDECCYYIEPNTLICAIEDLLYEIDKQKEDYKEELEYLRQDTDPNINYYEEQKLKE